MKTFVVVTLCLIFFSPIFSQSKLDFSSVILKTEQFPELTKKAVKLAVERNLPTSIFIKGKMFIQPVVVENNNVLYSVITDMLHPFNGGYLATIDEIENKFDLNNAKIKYYENRNSFIKSNHLKFAPGDSLYLIPESTNDRILIFNTNGDSIDFEFMPSHANNDTLNTPIEALYHKVRNSFVMSDQVLDVVQEFDTTGMFLTTYVPKGGRAVDTLDNVRGMAFHPNGNLLVTTAGGANSDAIAEFDIFGNFVGNFITPADSIMDSPFDVLLRANDVLIPAITSNGIHKYDLSGNYIDDFATSVAFPEQITELRNGEIAVANFSGATGIQIYPASGGTFTQLLTGVTGNRGVAELANGNLLTTNGSGIYIIDRTTGNIIETKKSGISARFISLYVVEENLNNAIFSISNNSINFGNVAKDSSKTDTLIISNEGNAQLLIFNAFPNHTNIAIAPDSGRIAINDSMLFEVTFTAPSDSTGESSGFIVFRNNAPSTLDTVDFTANIVTGLTRPDDLIPKSYSLSQNYPNPFNPTTNINFSLPVSEHVTLKIFNIKGEEIETLITKRLAAGEYNLKYNATDFPSGVYIYSIQAGDFKQSNKMILIK